MLRMFRVSSVALVLAFVALGLSHPAAQQPGLRGFPDDAVSAQRQREEQFRKVPDTARLKEYMEVMAAEPHTAGQPASRKVAEYALAKFKSWGLDASIEEFEAMMPWPTERTVEMIAPTKYTLQLKEPVLSDDPDSADANQTPQYNAYSGDGDVTGEVVYVNYGVPADYDKLKELGIDVKGKIVLARYGQSWRGIKPKVGLRTWRDRLLDLFRSARRRLLTRATSIRAAPSVRSSVRSAEA